ncbi:hypothetical protein [Streptomyces marincola]|uniref:DUF3558 domain-containing protein n=1 Tax=Streptomyces marincola TaxID=2878388 RepID=A0A1W7CTQ9_9ACTN|nr:hypothetical protein [Streptomyces marincola]ARQ68203.1 hypothetical protein CAG99_04515 [Streptomyces marincola]
MTAYRSFSRSGAPILLGLAVLLTACSGDDTNYAIPAEICETAIAPETLQVLLPPGDEFEAASAPVSTTVTCEVSIDSRLYIDITGYAVVGALDPSEHARALQLENSVEENWGVGMPAVLADKGALVSLPCGAGDGTDAMLVQILVIGDHVPENERRQRVTDFTRSYVTGLAEQLDCDARPASAGPT